jgi:Na+-transporting NADH:ubiquinone oxidoreductase subunit C
MNDSIVKTLGVAFAICLICSLVVSSTAVSLRDMQNENKANDKRTKILQAAGIFNPELDIKEQFYQLEEKYLDFNSGKLLRGSDLEVFLEEHKGDYDQIAATRKPEYSTSLDSSEDIAIIKNRENVGKFFILRNKDNSIDKIILPVRGYGLWGTLFGYISIEEDFNTVAGLEFYDHKETPGLGAEVDNPKWKALWPGKQLYKNNIVSLEVIKGKVPVDDKNLNYKVDGLSGATLTSRGVTNMLKYWFSDSGYANLFSELEYES